MLPLFILTIEDTAKQHRCARLYAMYQRYMYQVAVLVLKNESDAEDTVNQVFLGMIEKNTLPDPEDPRTKAYLARAAYNSALNLYIRNNHFETVDLDEIEESIGAEPQVQDDASELQNAIARLPNIYKDPLILYYYWGYSTKEIAGRLGRGQKTVQKQLQRARQLLKEMLQNE